MNEEKKLKKLVSWIKEKQEKWKEYVEEEIPNMRRSKICYSFYTRLLEKIKELQEEDDKSDVVNHLRYYLLKLKARTEKGLFTKEDPVTGNLDGFRVLNKYRKMYRRIEKVQKKIKKLVNKQEIEQDREVQKYFQYMDSV